MNTQNHWRKLLPYSQAIRINQISSNQVDLNNSLKEMKNNLVKQGYDPSLINGNLERISLLNRIDLITEKDTRKKSDRIPLVIIYNWFLPIMIKTIRKNWNISQTNENFKEISKNEPRTAFKWNKKIRMFGIHWIEHGRVKKDLKEIQWIPCRSKAGNICFKQVKTTTAFKSQQTKKTCKIFHNTSCKGEHTIYLMECTICNLQYAAKIKTPFRGITGKM